MDLHEEPDSPLQTLISTLPTLPLHTTIQTIASLLPSLTPLISPTGTRLISHPDYPGLAILNSLGRIYLDAACRCTDEHAPFKTRLLHTSLDKPIGDLYGLSEDKLRKGLDDGSVKFPPLSPDERASALVVGVIRMR